MLGIVYRDLKPENVLVREDRHIMLSDFDLSLRCAVSPTLVKAAFADVDLSKKILAFCVQPVIGNQVTLLPEFIAEPTSARSMSFAGTHEYLVPEIIKGEGHGSIVDWWTLGIFLYELLFGKTPFKGSGNLAWSVIPEILRGAFSEKGNALGARVVLDPCEAISIACVHLGNICT
eukprot:Gb_02530 [translate_table: standard]